MKGIKRPSRSSRKTKKLKTSHSSPHNASEISATEGSPTTESLAPEAENTSRAASPVSIEGMSAAAAAAAEPQPEEMELSPATSPGDTRAATPVNLNAAQPAATICAATLADLLSSSMTPTAAFEDPQQSETVSKHNEPPEKSRATTPASAHSVDDANYSPTGTITPSSQTTKLDASPSAATADNDCDEKYSPTCTPEDSSIKSASASSGASSIVAPSATPAASRFIAALVCDTDPDATLSTVYSFHSPCRSLSGSPAATSDANEPDSSGVGPPGSSDTQLDDAGPSGSPDSTTSIPNSSNDFSSGALYRDRSPDALSETSRNDDVSSTSMSLPGSPQDSRPKTPPHTPPDSPPDTLPDTEACSLPGSPLGTPPYSPPGSPFDSRPGSSPDSESCSFPDSPPNSLPGSPTGDPTGTLPDAPMDFLPGDPTDSLPGAATGSPTGAPQGLCPGNATASFPGAPSGSPTAAPKASHQANPTHSFPVTPTESLPVDTTDSHRSVPPDSLASSPPAKLQHPPAPLKPDSPARSPSMSSLVSLESSPEVEQKNDEGDPNDESSPPSTSQEDSSPMEMPYTNGVVISSTATSSDSAIPSSDSDSPSSSNASGASPDADSNNSPPPIIVYEIDPEREIVRSYPFNGDMYAINESIPLGNPGTSSGSSSSTATTAADNVVVAHQSGSSTIYVCGAQGASSSSSPGHLPFAVRIRNEDSSMSSSDEEDDFPGVLLGSVRRAPVSPVRPSDPLQGPSRPTIPRPRTSLFPECRGTCTAAYSRAPNSALPRIPRIQVTLRPNGRVSPPNWLQNAESPQLVTVTSEHRSVNIIMVRMYINEENYTWAVRLARDDDGTVQECDCRRDE